MNSLAAFVGRNSDAVIVALVMGILLALFVPVPAALLDFLILLNVTLALLVLLMTFYAPRPVDFSTFPALLLIATLFRLALNVSATRLILSQASAGKVIAAVGAFVVGGNYVIGLIIFLILVVVQYVVVTSGAQRVSEVSARFTLDSIPGQQMSIDADLNMGFIDQEEAKRRRKVLEREAAFYGAMDGASKFVKGDAIAGIVIMLINILGGLVIGVLQQGMPWGEALRHYTLLTIGDGIVTQIPALVISVGTGLIVTRSSSDGELGREVLRQLLSFPRTLAILIAVVSGVAVLPGIPVVPVAVVVLLLGIAYAWSRKQQAERPDADVPQAEPSQPPPPGAHDLAPLVVELGSTLAAEVGGSRGELSSRMDAFRNQFSQETGFVIPALRFVDTPSLGAEEYRILLFGDIAAAASVRVGFTLAIHPTGATGGIAGIETKEPTYGLPAVWIQGADLETARSRKYTLVDPMTVLFTHLCELIRSRCPELLTRAEVERMLALVRAAQPGLVEELVPTQMAMSDVQAVMRNLLGERVPVRNLQAIVESLLHAARTTKDVAELTEQVRQRLALSICNSLSGDHRTLQVLTLDPAVEEGLLRTFSVIERAAEGASSRRPDARLLDSLVPRLAAEAERMMKSNLVPVMLCAPDLRRHLRRLCERVVPHLRIISLSEVAAGFELRAFASVVAGVPTATNSSSSDYTVRNPS